MIEFSELDDRGVVLRTIVIEPEMLATGRWGDPAKWVQSCDRDGNPTSKNKPGVGHTYDKARDAFIAPKPLVGATLDEATCQWKVPGMLAAPTGNITK